MLKYTFYVATQNIGFRHGIKDFLYKNTNKTQVWYGEFNCYFFKVENYPYTKFYIK